MAIIKLFEQWLTEDAAGWEDFEVYVSSYNHDPRNIVEYSISGLLNGTYDIGPGATRGTYSPGNGKTEEPFFLTELGITLLGEADANGLKKGVDVEKAYSILMANPKIKEIDAKIAALCTKSQTIGALNAWKADPKKKLYYALGIPYDLERITEVLSKRKEFYGSNQRKEG